MSTIDLFFVFIMVVLILLLMCAIVGKMIAKQKEQEQFEKTCCPIRTIDFENHSAAQFKGVEIDPFNFYERINI